MTPFTVSSRPGPGLADMLDLRSSVGGTFSRVSMVGQVSVGLGQLCGFAGPDAHVLHQRQQVLHSLRLVQLELCCRPLLALPLRLHAIAP